MAKRKTGKQSIHDTMKRLADTHKAALKNGRRNGTGSDKGWVVSWSGMRLCRGVMERTEFYQNGDEQRTPDDQRDTSGGGGDEV